MLTPLWTPTAERKESANITKFAHWLKDHGAVDAESYQALHQWSVTQPEKFWDAVWDYTGVIGEKGSDRVLLDGDKMPGAQWYPDAKLNFAENLLRTVDEKVAIVSRLENGERHVLSYAELYQKVAQLAAALRAAGVVANDRVAAFMPNVAETVVGMLATASIGAIWSSCSPDFGINGVMDRFGQIQPKVLFACDGYFYNGKTIDSLPRIAEILGKIDSIEKLVLVPVTHRSVPQDLNIETLPKVVLFDDFLIKENTPGLVFEQMPFSHPLYIMYSSGTTGVPKCIVHSAGGTLLQHLKEHTFHVDLNFDDVLFYFTTCGWMMWNWLASGLARDATLVLYDGSPFYPEPKALIDMVDEEGISIFGTSAKYIAALEKAGVTPKNSHQLTDLKAILSTGSPLSHESFNYVYRDIKSDLCLSSISGGTDILSCFVLGCPTLPVYAGQLQCRGLGMAVEIWDDNGKHIEQKKGELVCIKPFPSMPVGFWNDPEEQKYRSAYFEQYPNIWAHGDYAEITEEGGVIIHGRSDAVLNPGGVRIGTAEIYRQVEKVEEVLDSICIGQEWDDDVRVVLFVVLREGIHLTDQLKQKIRQTIRANTTPRHVPAKLIQVADIPRTISGKIVELAVRQVVHGQKVKNTDALANPQALALFRELEELKN
ncbi:MAG: acetoacetate--CoA ligase [Pseudomonadales bacterium]|nr:acetoacetate--CoA ligase [Pseudomonadales bacterium]MCP5215041.1 acetoacetate--CoA ligase [Pseudomonadales bacterium]